MTKIKLYAVWSEGYSATGERGGASLLGEAEAFSFAQACDKVAKSLSQPELYDSVRLTYWACRLYDNESDARKRFG